ncbi:MAG: tRNA uridine-5-carboxymethylaminomethyl(34) synthesis GTPase MnmE [Eubacteriales bacterium]|nr:tRNA uridine-5-carboxymethylaminomethyl(34) synthesis GTPase MnmE [Eubacteriales bacterium]
MADRIFVGFKGSKRFSQQKSHSAAYGKIINPDSGDTIDEVVILKFKGPNSFTAEDVVEIDCHGGIVLQLNILELVIKQGARPAGPGEFTKRAFLNGRIDLSQAEAVIDLINSKTSLSSQTAAKQLEGRLSELLGSARNQLVELLAHIDATVDYPEHDLEKVTGEMVSAKLKEIRTGLQQLLSQFEKGRIIREGISVVITGRPNVGKSSLLNRLSGRNRAIVTDIPGTTRDVLEEYISIKGIPVRVVDTAGIRHTDDIVEKLGVEKTMSELKSADMAILMLDAAKGMNDDEKQLLTQIGGMRHLVVINKTDLSPGEEILNYIRVNNGKRVNNGNNGKRGNNGNRDNSGNKKVSNIIMMSLVEGTGIGELEEAIAETFFKGEMDTDSDILLTNARHKDLVSKALEGIDRALEAYESGMPLDILSIEIGSAAQSIGEITGEDVSESVMEEIFSRFCIGK